MTDKVKPRVALIEAGSPGLNIYSHVAMGRGAAVLGTVLRDAGYDTRVFIEDIAGKDTVEWEWVAGADIVGFSAITCTMPRTAELLATTRRVAPQATVVFGGPEPTCDPQRSFDAGADLVLRGEAELTLPRLAAVLTGASREPFGDIEGLMWREEGRIVEGRPSRQLTAAELDAVPLVDRSLIHHAERNTVAPVWRTRGCPQRCDFCEVCEIWPRYTRRSDERSIAELMDAQAAGYPTSFLIDDNAAGNRGAFKRFLNGVAEHGYTGMLVAQLRADSAFLPDGRLDRELLRLLKRAAAVTVICVGVESASDDDLALIHKGTDSRRMARALSAMRRTGLLVHGMFIALNNDTRDTVRRNGAYARRYVTSLQYLFETPLPGTKRTHDHEQTGALLFKSLTDLNLYDGMHVVIRPLNMAAWEMQQLVAREYARFYSVRRIVAAALSGAFLRFRRLTDGQRRQLADLTGFARLRLWAWFHIEYKFAPVSFLAIGRRRLRALLNDSDYARYQERLRTL